MALLPDQSMERQKKNITPLIEYLKREYDLNFKLVYVNDYQEILDKFVDGQIDLAYLGGVTFVKSYLSGGADPLVMRSKDANFTSYIISSSQSSANSLEDLRGKTFSFGSRLSTSGHYMPRHFLENKKMFPEKYFKEIIYSGAHDKTIQLVADKKIYAGAVNSSVYHKMLNEDPLLMKKTKIIWQSPPFPDYVWAANPLNVSKKVKEKIIKSFLNLSVENEKNKNVLDGLSAKYFIAATIQDFNSLIELMKIYE